MKKIKGEIVKALKFYNEENKNNLSPTATAKLFGIDKATLLTYIRDTNSYENLIEYNGVYYYLDDMEYQAINDYINTDINFLGIRNKYGYKQETFKKKLEVIGYPTERKYKCNYNRDRFKTIETEEDAYILGFILADGYIHEKSNMLRIKLKERDVDILEKFCDYFEMDYSFIKEEIHQDTGNKQKYLSIYCKEIIDRLKSYGLYQGKSCKEVPYYDIDKNLVRHYIRGIWDGDGYLSKDGSKMGVCGSEEVLDYIHEHIILNVNDISFTSSFTGVNEEKDSNIYRLNYSGKKIKNISNYLYENATIYLNRKYELYKLIDDMYQ